VAWLVIGLIGGFFASHFVCGHGFGLIGDIVLGVVGAFLGGLLASVVGFHGSEGFWGTIVVAFIGAARATGRYSHQLPSGFFWWQLQNSPRLPWTLTIGRLWSVQLGGLSLLSLLLGV